MKYIYPAVFTKEESLYSVNFPDVPSCYTQGGDLSEAMENANDVLCLTLYNIEKMGNAVPTPSDIKNIVTDDNSFVSLISCDTIEYRKFYDTKAIKKTLTIPSWLNDIATENKVNFSAVLQSALLEKLGLNA